MQAIAEARFARQIFSQIESRFDPEYGVLWGFMKPTPRPTFNTLLLEEAREFAKGITDSPRHLLRLLLTSTGLLTDPKALLAAIKTDDE